MRDDQNHVGRLTWSETRNFIASQQFSRIALIFSLSSFPLFLGLICIRNSWVASSTSSENYRNESYYRPPVEMPKEPANPVKKVVPAPRFNHPLPPQLATTDTHDATTDTQGATIPHKLAANSDSKLSPLSLQGLSGVDRLFLRLASHDYFLNQKHVLKKQLSSAIPLLRMTAAAETDSPQKRAAQIMVVQEFLIRCSEVALKEEWMSIEDEASRFFATAIQGAGAGIKQNELPSAATFVYLAGPLFEKWREKERAKWIRVGVINICQTVSNINLANNMQSLMTKVVDYKKLKPIDGLDFTPLKYRSFLQRIDGDAALRAGLDSVPSQVTEPSFGAHAEGGDDSCFYKSYFLATKYSGSLTLTDVVFIDRLTTTGASTTLAPGERSMLRYNAAGGFGAENSTISAMLETEHFYDTMPKGGMIYVPRLEPGDILYIPLGEIHTDFLLGAKISMISNQGWVPERFYDLSEIKGPSPRDSMGGSGGGANYPRKRKR